MFNRTFNTNIDYHNSPETIEIKNAPTSDQIRLLREMEEDLKKEYLRSIKVDDNKFNIALFLRSIPNSDTTTLIARLTLNDEEIVIEQNYCGVKYKYTAPGEFFKEFVDKLSSKISERIIRKALIDNERVMKDLFGAIGDKNYR
jgi:hypothetical protein